MNNQASKDLRQLLHDIRNPLNTISINAELGKLGLEQGKDDVKISHLMDVILNQCTLCSSRLDELEIALHNNLTP